MSYDLFAWPVDRAMTDDEAIAEIREKSSRRPVGFGRDRRINAFVNAMNEAFPDIGTMRQQAPMEFDVHRDNVHMALPWSMVTYLIRTIAPIAFDAGLAVYDPQREVVALPAPFGAAPMDAADVEEHERMFQNAFGILTGSSTDGGSVEEQLGHDHRHAAERPKRDLRI